nr:SRPBCC family protein [uncultured Methanobacterium sp.]
MKEIYTEIEINASASTVWDILTDFDKFPKWNPFMKKISGNLQEGANLEAFIQPPNSNG